MNLRTKLVKGTPNKAAIYEEDEPFAKNDMSHDPLITTQTIKAREEVTLVEQAQSIKDKLSARKNQQIKGSFSYQKDLQIVSKYIGADNHKRQMLGQQQTQQKQNLTIQQAEQGALDKFSVKTKKKDLNQLKNTVKLLSPFLVAGQHPNIEKKATTLRVSDDAEAKTKSTQSNKQRHIIFGLAHIRAFMQDFPEIMNQSIEYLSTLAELNQMSKGANTTLIKSSIINYFTNLFLAGNSIFFKYSTELLNNRLHIIIQEFRSSQHPPQIKIQIQILSQFFKILLQSQQYLPSDARKIPLHLKLTAIAQALKLPLKQCNYLRKIYFQHHSQVTYLEQNPNIRPLINTYYFILLKQKGLLEASNRPRPQNQLNEVVKQLQTYKKQANEKAKYNAVIKEKYLLSVLYANRQTTRKDPAKSKESLETIQNYEKMLSSSNLRLVVPNVQLPQQENGVIIKMEEDQESESQQKVCYKRSEYVKEEDEMSEENQLQEGLLSTHFPRSQCKEEIDASSSHILPENQIMENLKGRSTNDLRFALAQLLQLNKNKLFGRNFQRK